MNQNQKFWSSTQNHGEKYLFHFIFFATIRLSIWFLDTPYFLSFVNYQQGSVKYYCCLQKVCTLAYHDFRTMFSGCWMILLLLCGIWQCEGVEDGGDLMINQGFKWCSTIKDHFTAHSNYNATSLHHGNLETPKILNQENLDSRKSCFKKILKHWKSWTTENLESPKHWSTEIPKHWNLELSFRIGPWKPGICFETRNCLSDLNENH